MIAIEGGRMIDPVAQRQAGLGARATRDTFVDGRAGRQIPQPDPAPGGGPDGRVPATFGTAVRR